MRYQYTTDVLTRWLPIAVAVTGLALLAYGATQQTLRQTFNDPQIQFAEDTARVVALGANPAKLIPAGAKTDIASSLSLWLAVYDAEGAPVASTGLLDNAVPQVPQGVLAAASGGENRVTWQPAPGVRQAIVVVRAGDKGYAISGRNMREMEAQTDHIGVLVLAGWLVIMSASFAAQLIVLRRS